MSTVTFTATFSGGQGSITFDGEGIDPHKMITTDGPHSFTVTQNDPNQSITVTPVIPQGQAGDPGEITVKVTDDTGKVLSPAADNTYEPFKDAAGNMVFTFDAFINYDL